jgi:hypothetical protein
MWLCGCVRACAQEEESNGTHNLEGCHNVDDVHSLAAAKLTPGAAAYYAAGAEDGNSIRENLQVSLNVP